MRVIQVEQLSKKFILSKSPNTLKEKLLLWNKHQPAKEFWALRDIDLEIKAGESVGIIGKNGSGKSTLLKVISKILYPTKGRMAVKGKVSSLLELGAGFKPDYTGLENIYLNASILGFSRKETDKKLEEIIDFSELGEFITQPVRNYSSGMYMRLAYSIAVSAEPSILLIDEILAVGDTGFKEKGLNRILELKQKGTTILLVSHSDSMIKKVCDKVVWLENGRKLQEGSCEDVFPLYQDSMKKKER